MSTYIVTKHGVRQPLTVQASSSDQAKRIACQIHGCWPSDAWCGISAYRAQKIKEAP